MAGINRFFQFASDEEAPYSDAQSIRSPEPSPTRDDLECIAQHGKADVGRTGPRCSHRTAAKAVIAGKRAIVGGDGEAANRNEESQEGDRSDDEDCDWDDEPAYIIASAVDQEKENLKDWPSLREQLDDILKKEKNRRVLTYNQVSIVISPIAADGLI